jgi:hypothetical protein
VALFKAFEGNTMSQVQEIQSIPVEHAVAEQGAVVEVASELVEAEQTALQLSEGSLEDVNGAGSLNLSLKLDWSLELNW